jgi:hypothetical protein
MARKYSKFPDITARSPALTLSKQVILVNLEPPKRGLSCSPLDALTLSFPFIYHTISKITDSDRGEASDITDGCRPAHESITASEEE